MTFSNTIAAALGLGLLVAAAVPGNAIAASGSDRDGGIGFCVPPSKMTPSGLCTIVERPWKTTPATGSRPRENGRFDKWRIERGTFGAIEMNGVMQR